MGSFAGDVRPDPTPLSATASAESMTKQAVVDAELSETLLACGESDELFKTGTVVPAEVARSTRDMFVGSSTEVTNDISQLKFLQAPQYRVEVANMKNYDELLSYLDHGRVKSSAFVAWVVED